MGKDSGSKGRKTQKLKAPRTRRDESLKLDRDEPLKLDKFSKKPFNPKDKEHVKVIDAAIADGRREDKTESAELVRHVFDKAGFLKKKHSVNVGAQVNKYVIGQCNKEDVSKQPQAWWKPIKNIVTATNAQLLEVVMRDGVAFAVYSNCGKQLCYPLDSGLCQYRGSIGFSVQKFGEDGATQLAREETQATLGLLEKFAEQVKNLPKDVRTDIAARKESGGAVPRIKGGALKNLDTGIARVEVGGESKLRVRYVAEGGGYEYEDFPDTLDGHQRALVFVYKTCPRAVRLVQNAANLEALPGVASLSELPVQHADVVAAYDGTVPPPRVEDEGSRSVAARKKRSAASIAAAAVPPPPKRVPRKQRAPASQPLADAGKDAGPGLGFDAFVDDDVTEAAQRAPTAKHFKDNDGAAVPVVPGIDVVFDGVIGADHAAAKAWLKQQQFSSVGMLTEVNDAAFVEEFLTAASVSAPGSRALVVNRIRDLVLAPRGASTTTTLLRRPRGWAANARATSAPLPGPAARHQRGDCCPSIPSNSSTSPASPTASASLH